LPFLQLTLDVGTADPEALESACFASGALSVTLSDAADSPILEPAPGVTPLWPSVRLSAVFAGEREPAEVATAVAAIVGAPLPPHHFERVADREWEREWLRDFGPMRFGARLWVCPNDEPPPDPQATVVWLDPGLAFGTGTHPSTALCLEWLDAAALNGFDIIDYGCGSGILAIAAVKLGAASVAAVDIDPQALIATEANARHNGVDDRIVTGTPEARLEPVDVVLANIVFQPLIDLAPRFASLIRPGGQVVLAGILTSQAETVTAAYRPWFDIQLFSTRDEWVCLSGCRTWLIGHLQNRHTNER
jgi:ribosomal protein L11 methyltransferase